MESKFQYMIEKIKYVDDLDLEAQLNNDIGSAGWEIVSAHLYRDDDESNVARLICKREISTPAEELLGNSLKDMLEKFRDAGKER